MSLIPGELRVEFDPDLSHDEKVDRQKDLTQSIVEEAMRSISRLEPSVRGKHVTKDMTEIIRTCSYDYPKLKVVRTCCNNSWAFNNRTFRWLRRCERKNFLQKQFDEVMSEFNRLSDVWNTTNFYIDCDGVAAKTGVLVMAD